MYQGSLFTTETEFYIAYSNYKVNANLITKSRLNAEFTYSCFDIHV